MRRLVSSQRSTPKVCARASTGPAGMVEDLERAEASTVGAT